MDNVTVQALMPNIAHTHYNTDLVLASNVLSVTEVANSHAMELEGLKRCLNDLEAHAINFVGIVTDRHKSVRSFLRSQYPEVEHQFDIFHVAKGITKDLTKQGKKEGGILPWVQA